VKTIFELVDADDGDAIRDLLARNPEAAGERDEQELSPLFRAAYRNRTAAFAAIRSSVPPTDPWERLIAGESDGLPAPDAWSVDGFTPLHLAAFAGNAAAVRALLAAGADPDALSRAPFARVTPLGTAAFAGSHAIARTSSSTEPTRLCPPRSARPSTRHGRTETRCSSRCSRRPARRRARARRATSARPRASRRPRAGPLP